MFHRVAAAMARALGVWLEEGRGREREKDRERVRIIYK
jgi:hypothetical protein